MDDWIKYPVTMELLSVMKIMKLASYLDVLALLALFTQNGHVSLYMISIEPVVNNFVLFHVTDNKAQDSWNSSCSV